MKGSLYNNNQKTADAASQEQQNKPTKDEKPQQKDQSWPENKNKITGDNPAKKQPRAHPGRTEKKTQQQERHKDSIGTNIKS